jgi:hypothetical protein
MPRWIGRLLWSLRGKRRVRLHLVKPGTPIETIEGVLMGRWSGHYVLLLPQVLVQDGTSHPLDGTIEVPAENVLFVQVLTQ